MGDFARSGRFMRAREDLCALGRIYARPGGIYARPGGFMRAQEDLCALREIYARSGRLMSAREDLCALREFYARPRMIYARHARLLLLRTGPPRIQAQIKRCLIFVCYHLKIDITIIRMVRI
jgi:ADP-ribose pyrophosphatase YjhB (NUDIX family)